MISKNYDIDKKDSLDFNITAIDSNTFSIEKDGLNIYNKYIETYKENSFYFLKHIKKIVFISILIYPLEPFLKMCSTTIIGYNFFDGNNIASILMPILSFLWLSYVVFETCLLIINLLKSNKIKMEMKKFVETEKTSILNFENK